MSKKRKKGRPSSSGKSGRHTDFQQLRDNIRQLFGTNPIHQNYRRRMLNRLVLIKDCQSRGYESALLYHSQQFPMFEHQTEIGVLDIDYFAKLFAHNLRFYEEWMAAIQAATRDKSLDSMLEKYLPRAFHTRLNDMFSIELYDLGA